MDDILDHITNDHAVRRNNTFINYRLGHKTWRCATKGWFLWVRCKYGPDSWLTLKYLNNSNPV